MCEHGCRASHHEGHDDPNIRPKQLRNREVPWAGSHRSKLMSRRTERPYQVDGAGEHAPQGAAPCSAPEINGPVVPREFTSLLRETCAFQHGGDAGRGDSRGSLWEHRSQPRPWYRESRAGEHTGGTHNSGRAELGRQTRPSVVLSRSVEADRPSSGQRSPWQRKSAA